MSLLKPAIKLIRPTQWIKNGFVFMPLIFGTRLLVIDDVLKVAGMFIAFCLASSATYVLNDYMDMDQDRVHPLKKHRPLAAGDISPAVAMVMMIALLVGTFAVSAVVAAPWTCHLLVAAYLVLHTAYSVKLKDIVIIDVLAISIGFLIRVLVGADVIQVDVSSWLFLCTFSIAILLALGKRRHEVVLLNSDAANHRPVLDHYGVVLLDQLLQVVTTSTFIFYCLYSVQGHQGTGVSSEKMMFTIPLVTYGIFRYLYLIYEREAGGSPTRLLFTDPPLLACTILWLTTCSIIVYY